MVLLLICLAPALLPLQAAAPASATFLSGDWRRYVPAPASRTMLPTSVLAASTGVADGGGILRSGGGSARLTLQAGGSTPYLDIDFGQVVVGKLGLRVTQSSDPAPEVRIAFSETRQYLGWKSDFSRSDAAGGPGTDDLIPDPAGQTWSDQAGCQAGKQVCSDGVRAFRYVRIYLGTAPGDAAVAAPQGFVAIDAVWVDFSAFLGTPATYRGWFLSSDDLLNRIWYGSVYTTELDTTRFERDSADPRGSGAWTPAMNGKQVIDDGAKRDRIPYSGDLAIEGPVLLLAHADAMPVSNVLIDLANHQQPDGYIPPSPFDGYSLHLFDYPAWWVIALHDEVLYTGDVALAHRLWPALTRLLDDWYPSVTDADGLLSRPPASSATRWGDYAFLPRGGEVTEDSANEVRALDDAAELADALGEPARSAAWRARAERVAAAINQRLWDGVAGAYVDSMASRDLHSQDANAFAIVAGVADPARRDAALAYLARMDERPWGNSFVDRDDWFSGASGRVYPFISAEEVAARFTAGEDDQALDQIRRTWGWMLAHDPGGTMWEAIGAGGSIASYAGAYTSLAHGWSSGAATLLTNDLLGVVPTGLGFNRYDVMPHPGDVAWAQGRVPTPRGSIDVAWNYDEDEGVFSLELATPAGTTGRIGVPTFGKRITVNVDGREIWNGSSPAMHAGLAVSESGGYILISGVGAGRHAIVSRVI